MTTTETDLTTLTAWVHESVPILGRMGIEVLEARPGRAAAKLPLEPNGNHFGVLYAGSLFSAAEMLGGLIAMTSFPLEGFVPLVKSLDIHFRRPGLGDVKASTELTLTEVERVKAEAMAHGKAEYVLEATVVDAAGETVVTTTGVYQLRKL
jgi:thioesterase domain-containing protein